MTKAGVKKRPRPSSFEPLWIICIEYDRRGFSGFCVTCWSLCVCVCVCVAEAAHTRVQVCVCVCKRENSEGCNVGLVGTERGMSCTS